MLTPGPRSYRIGKLNAQNSLCIGILTKILYENTTHSKSFLNIFIILYDAIGIIARFICITQKFLVQLVIDNQLHQKFWCSLLNFQVMQMNRANFQVPMQESQLCILRKTRNYSTATQQDKLTQPFIILFTRTQQRLLQKEVGVFWLKSSS